MGKDPESGEKACPSVWVHSNGNIVVQGWIPDDDVMAACLATRPVPPSEAVVVLPPRMTDLIKEACELAERQAGHGPESGEKACPSVWVHSNGNIVVQGWIPDDDVMAACLATGPVPPSEAVVVLPPRMTDLIKEACELAGQRADIR